MFAIIKSGGKQYRVEQGDVLRLESLDAQVGETVDLPVLLMGGDEVQVGTPRLEGSRARAEVVGHGRGRKVYVEKYKAKVNYNRRRGHRQPYTEVRITGLEG